MEEKDKYAAQKRYAAKNKRSFKLDCMKSTESDIIEKLENTPNYARYIKNLIRADMETTKNKK